MSYSYIDRIRVIAAITGQHCARCPGLTNSDYADCNVCGIQHCINAIKLVPGEDVDPVKKGKWEPQDEGDTELWCSCCNDWFILEPLKKKYKYCPNCGARMEQP